MTDRQSAADDATRSFYDRVSERYDAVAEDWEHASRQQGLKALAVTGEESVLEIGYGTGHALARLAQAAPEVVGLDISDGMRSVARRRLVETGLDGNVGLDLGDARVLPYQKGRFDAVFMSYTLELFDPVDIVQVLAEASRVLRAGGRLGIVALAQTDPPSLMDEIYQRFHDRLRHYAGCQPIDAFGALRAAGFQIREATGMTVRRLPLISMIGIKPDGAWY